MDDGAHCVTAIGACMDDGAHCVTAIGACMDDSAHCVTAIGACMDDSAHCVTAIRRIAYNHRKSKRSVCRWRSTEFILEIKDGWLDGVA